MKKILLSGIFVLLFVSSAFAWTKPQFNRELPNNYGLVNINDVFIDVPVASTHTILDVSISTQTLVANTTSYVLISGDFTDIIVPRNIVVDTNFASGESTTTFSGSLVITGFDQFGNAQTETIAVSTNSATGVKVWSTITKFDFISVVISGSSVADVSLQIGNGNKIALSNNLDATADIVKVIEDGATSTTYVLDVDNDAITFASAPDNSKDYRVVYVQRTRKERYKY